MFKSLLESSESCRCTVNVIQTHMRRLCKRVTNKELAFHISHKPFDDVVLVVLLAGGGCVAGHTDTLWSAGVLLDH